MTRPVSTTTPLPAAWISSASRARSGARRATKSGRCQVMAPYDSMKTSRTSAPSTSERSEFISGDGAERLRPRDDGVAEHLRLACVGLNDGRRIDGNLRHDLDVAEALHHEKHRSWPPR